MSVAACIPQMNKIMQVIMNLKYKKKLVHQYMFACNSETKIREKNVL